MGIGVTTVVRLTDSDRQRENDEILRILKGTDMTQTAKKNPEPAFRRGDTVRYVGHVHFQLSGKTGLVMGRGSGTYIVAFGDIEKRVPRLALELVARAGDDNTTVSAEKLVDGYKADEEKVRMDLLPPELLFAVADILTFGAKKYADRNWEKGMKWGRVFGALTRHLWAWWGGKTKTKHNFLFGDLDMETGRSHLWHAGCCIAFLIAYEARGIGTDDRFAS